MSLALSPPPEQKVLPQVGQGTPEVSCCPLVVGVSEVWAATQHPSAPGDPNNVGLVLQALGMRTMPGKVGQLPRTLLPSAPTLYPSGSPTVTPPHSCLLCVCTWA